MIITKSFDSKLLLEDLLEIVVIDFTKCSINISYTFKTDCENIGFCNINDIEYLGEMLDYLNQERAACLIYIGEKNKNNPVHLTTKLCFACDLFPKLNRKYETNDLIKNLLNLHEKPFDNLENSAIVFNMLKTALDYDDLLIYMDIKGQFRVIREFIGFEHEKINYYSPKVYYRPAKPIEISFVSEKQANFEYAGCYYPGDWI